MVDKQKVKPIRIVNDPNFSVVTHDGFTIYCNPSVKKCKVYALFSTIELRLYIGITKHSLKKRDRYRRREIIKNCHRATIHKAIIDQGSENFVMFELNAFETKQEAANEEMRLIVAYQTHKNVGGYNSSWGGECCYEWAELEEVGKKTVHNIIDFKKLHGRWPSSNYQKIEGEKSLGRALADLRVAFNNPEITSTTFRDSYQQIAEERNESDMFKSRKKTEDHGKKMVNEIIDFKKLHGRWPNKRSIEKREKLIGIAFSTLRVAFKRPGYISTNFHPSYQVIAEERGESDMFKSRKKTEEYGKKLVHKIIDFKELHGRWPSGRYPKIEGEKSLGVAYVGIKHSFNNPEGSRRIFYPIYQVIAEERGQPEMFASLEELGKKKFHKIIDFKKLHGRWPSGKSPKIDEEKSLGNALIDLKKGFKDSNSKHRFFLSYQDIAKERNEPEMFFCKEQRKNSEIENFAKFVAEKGRLPKNCIKEEKQLYKWIYTIRSDIRSGKPNRWTYSNNETAERLGVLHYFK